MELTILGNNSAVPCHDRHPSSQHLIVGSTHILIDCGEGTQMRLIEQKLSPLKLDIILISHLHGDHVFGLAPLLSTMNLQGREKPIEVYGPTNLRPLVELTLGYSGSVLNYQVNYIDVEVSDLSHILETEQILIQAIPLIHRGPTYGYKIIQKEGPLKLNGKKADEVGLSFEGRKKLKMGESYHDVDGKVYDVNDFTEPGQPSKSFAYCSDTIYTETIIPMIENVDLLYHETTYIEELQEKARERFHATSKEAATIAKKAGVKKLLIGHFSSRYKDPALLLNEAKEVFVETEIAEEGRKFEI